MAYGLRTVIGWILLIIAVLMLFGKGSVVSPILGLGFNVSIFHITVQAVILMMAAIYLIRR